MRYDGQWGHEIIVGRNERETVSRREYYESIGWPVPPEPEVPRNVEHVWFWFHEITRRRAPGFDGASPLTFTEVESWSRLTGTEIRPWEVELLFTIDDAFLDQRSTEAAAMRERNQEQSSGR